MGFRRSQNIAYCPACEACSACVSARIPASDYVFSRSERKILSRNEDVERHLVEAEATMEQFDLLRRYLLARHADGGMAEMTWPDYVAMVEDSGPHPHHRVPRPLEGRRPRRPDRLRPGRPDERRPVAGLQLLRPLHEPPQPGQLRDPRSRDPGVPDLPYVYLGYWVRGSEKMDYKVRFSPIELLKPDGWTLASARELRSARAE